MVEPDHLRKHLSVLRKEGKKSNTAGADSWFVKMEEKISKFLAVSWRHQPQGKVLSLIKGKKWMEPYSLTALR